MRGCEGYGRRFAADRGLDIHRAYCRGRTPRCAAAAALLPPRSAAAAADVNRRAEVIRHESRSLDACGGASCASPDGPIPRISFRATGRMDLTTQVDPERVKRKVGRPKSAKNSCP